MSADPYATSEYDGFLNDVLEAVEVRVEAWRVRLGEACTEWHAQGYATAVLERAGALASAPDVDALLATFAAAVDHLRRIEARAIALDPSLAGHAAFRNPESVAVAQQLLTRAIASARPLPAPITSHSRAQLELGPINQATRDAFDEIVAHPGHATSPLFVHGPSGVGKTHLAHAIGNALRMAWPQKRVGCAHAAAIVEELAVAMQEGCIEAWRARYRLADALIIDDVHLLMDKERTQHELFELCHQLQARGSQLVFTSDRSPRELLGLGDRARSLLASGVVSMLLPRARTTPKQDGGVTHAAFAQQQVAPGQLDDFFLDREKVIWDWPDLGGRVIEEYR